MKTVLVTGASGQLGRSIQKYSLETNSVNWLFMDSSEIDITSKESVEQCFQNKKIDYCINCAAYTNVEKAESEMDKAYQINAEAVRELAKICKKYDSVLIHISTDYVFDGRSKTPYSEEDQTNPINVYGATKLQGEINIQKHMNKYFIFRTSWLYSEYGNNFFLTIVKKSSENVPLNITTAQTGTPTNANHLAQLFLKLIKEENKNYGLYHFSNSGETTWYDFAEEILRVTNTLELVEINKDNSYKTIAARPEYSVLNKQKLEDTFNYTPATWQEALKDLHENRYQLK
jgi:dTDP-4-dehydrorhamnose reductase